MTGWQGSDRKATLPDDWQERRNAVRERAGDRCECASEHRSPEAQAEAEHLPSERCSRRGTDCDHAGNRHDHRLQSLQWLCSVCHDDKTAQDNSRRRSSGKRRARTHPGLIG